MKNAASRNIGFKAVLLAAVLGRLLLPLAGAQELPVLTTAYSEALLGEMNLNTVQATTAFWIDSFGIPKNVCKAGRVEFYRDAASWRDGARAQSYELGFMLVTDYLEMEAEDFLEPCFVFTDSGDDGAELLLIAYGGDSPVELADLKGQELFFMKGSYDTITHLWIDSLLAAGKLGPAPEFFGPIVGEERAQDVILSLLCAHRGACVVTRSGFEMIQELNPKLGENLVVLARSEKFVPVMICRPRNSDPELGNQVCAALGSLQDDLVGRHILMSFRIGGFQPYKPETIAPVRALFEARRKAAGPKVQIDKRTAQRRGGKR
ncbi:PhnD/SsuA/transferrin family substrate-binding protein [Pontiella sp.]|uniref:PhnD/SsuA/transferrin family substrate-binding protein n=1 Tax=Pontiella sp. TaxID=2837462 RepID=UPI003566006E